ncbi:hypothetical protein ACLB2K_002710 [Fragaria x ananassa]
MAFATCSRVSMMMLLALLVLAATTLAHNEGDDHATPSIQSLPSSEGSASAQPDDIVDMGLCAIQCAARCLGGKTKASMIATPDKFSFGKIWGKINFKKAICVSKCMVECAIDNANVKPELYHCTLGCAYMSAAKTKLTGLDAHTTRNNCYNKCEESSQG